MSLKDLVFDAGVDCVDEIIQKMWNALINALIALSHNQSDAAKKYFQEAKELRNKAGDIMLELDTKYK